MAPAFALASASRFAIASALAADSASRAAVSWFLSLASASRWAIASAFAPASASRAAASSVLPSFKEANSAASFSACWACSFWVPICCCKAACQSRTKRAWPMAGWRLSAVLTRLKPSGCRNSSISDRAAPLAMPATACSVARTQITLHWAMVVRPPFRMGRAGRQSSSSQVWPCAISLRPACASSWSSARAWRSSLLTASRLGHSARSCLAGIRPSSSGLLAWW